MEFDIHTVRSFSAVLSHFSAESRPVCYPSGAMVIFQNRFFWILGRYFSKSKLDFQLNSNRRSPYMDPVSRSSCFYHNETEFAKCWICHLVYTINEKWRKLAKLCHWHFQMTSLLGYLIMAMSSYDLERLEYQISWTHFILICIFYGEIWWQITKIGQIVPLIFSNDFAARLCNSGCV